jgi:sigma-54 dependent transcriptional regulator, acetoin dehydrogenase operon transcriptional activator AcoR
MPSLHQPAPVASPFFVTREARIELARRRYFDDGVAPTGIVSEAVFQSWARCERLHSSPDEEVVFQPVTESRTHLSLQKNRQLLEAWLDELPGLASLLGQTACAAMLTDATGVLIGATCAGRAHERVMPLAARIGVDLSEEAVGTTAPGVVARTGQPVTVQGGEHFFDGIRTMHCAAAPVRDIRGGVAGVLDLSSEIVGFGFDAAAVVGVYAAAMENRLLVAQAREHLVVRLQVAECLLDSPFAGLIGIDTLGRLAWCNAAAARLLGLSPELVGAQKPEADAVLGSGVATLASLPGEGACAVRLPNGLTVWARACMQAPDGRRGLVPVPARGAVGLALPAEVSPPRTVSSPHAAAAGEAAAGEPTQPTLGEEATAQSPATLRDADRELIASVVEACGGNRSEAARRLGVSRGLIYRRLPGKPGAHGH